MIWLAVAPANIHLEYLKRIDYEVDPYTYYLAGDPILDRSHVTTLTACFLCYQIKVSTDIGALSFKIQIFNTHFRDHVRLNAKNKTPWFNKSIHLQSFFALLAMGKCFLEVKPFVFGEFVSIEFSFFQIT